MNDNIPKNAAGGRTLWLSAVIPLLLMVGFYLYILLRIEPSLAYYQQWPVFMTTLDYFKSSLIYPGGPAVYLSLLLAQSYYFPWAGTLVITALVWLICLSSYRMLNKMAQAKLHPAWSVLPAIILMAVYGRFNFRTEALLPILLSLASFNLYAAVKPSKFITRLGWCVCLSLATYYIAGGAYVMTAVLIALYELLRGRHYLIGVVALLLGAAIPLTIGWYSYEIDYGEAFNLWLPFAGGVVPSWSAILYMPAILQLSLIGFFPIAALVATQHERLRKTSHALESLARPAKPPKGDDEQADQPSPAPKPAPVARIIRGTWTLRSVCLLFIFAVLVASYLFDADAKCYLKIDKYAQARQWEPLLVEVRALPANMYDEHVSTDVQRALYHTGRLFSDAFTYPQGQGIAQRPGIPTLSKLLLPYWTGLCIEFNSQNDVYFELGYLHRSLQMYHEIFELDGIKPTVLKRLAQIYILKGRVDVGRVFLRKLSQNLLFADWANEYLRKLNEDPTASFDEEVNHAKKVMLKHDHVFGGLGAVSYENKLRRLLFYDGNNKMAFQFLMVHYLMSRQADKLVEHFEQMRQLGYPWLPKSFQEAYLIRMIATPDLKPDLHGYTLDRETINRSVEFGKILATCLTPEGLVDPEAAIEKLQPDFGTTYLFYYQFGFSVYQADQLPRDSVTKAS